MRYALLLVIIGLSLYVFTLYRPTHNLILHVLDIGQGDSLYLRLPTGDDVVIDAGPDDRVLAKLGAAMPLGDREIELLIISHNHADHIGGIQAILSHYKVDRIWLSGAIHTTDQYVSMLKTIKAKQIPVTTIKAGNMSQIGSTQLIALYPVNSMIGAIPGDQHDATIVLKVSYQSFCALLTGDLSAHHEAELLAFVSEHAISIRCPVLKVTHHGSDLGSSSGFLAAVKPTTAVVSVGLKNRYGHPGKMTLERLRQLGVKIYRTDYEGTVTVTSDGNQFWTKTEK